jgi:beta-galactosidase/beta-glucuronidase
VNRHSFWPASGRTLSARLSEMDVRLMKEMNMNAVRLSHYPADDHFYAACD